VCPLLAGASGLVSVEGDYFDVVGVDNRSVAHVGELAERIAEQNNKYLGNGGAAQRSRILITLRPAEYTDFEGNSQLTLGDQGRVRLDFKWSEALTLQQACYAISEAYLTRYAIFQFGPSAPSKLRAWPVHALALDAYLTLRPAMLISQLQASKSAAFIDYQKLLDMPHSAEVSENFSHHAYYLFSALEEDAFGRNLLRSIVDKALSGGNTADAIASQVLPSDPMEETVTLGDWWRAQRDAIIATNYDIFEDLESSRRWIEQMINFDLYREAGGEMKNLRSLWNLREDLQMREILEARHEIIKLRLEIVNPLYFNAARSLGALFEIALADDVPSHVFMHTLVTYLGEFEDAKEIEETIAGLFDDSKK
jgi:hypothetical protein